jgi:hypothetical protein
VERPRGGSGNVPDELVKNLIATVENGKALSVQLDSHQHFITWQAGVRARCKNHGLKLRARFNKVTKKVTCWCEHFDKTRNVEDLDVGITNGNDNETEE